MKVVVQFARSRQDTNIKVNAISGAYIASFKTHLVLPELLDSSIDTSPILQAGMTPSLQYKYFDL